MARRSYTFLPPYEVRHRGLSLSEDIKDSGDTIEEDERKEKKEAELKAKRATFKSSNRSANRPWVPVRSNSSRFSLPTSSSLVYENYNSSNNKSLKQKMQTRNIVISPGNILSKTCTWRKGNESPSEELYESLKSCLELKQKDIDQNAFENGNSLEIVNSAVGTNEEVVEGRQELKVTLKLFLYSLGSNDLLTAIQQGLKTASVDYLDSVVISFAGQSEATPLSLEVVQKAWSVLEAQVNTDLVKMIGICDVETQLFVQLYEWATIKPGIMQINLASCCVVPPELTEFCNKSGVLLLTHSDPLNILPEDKLTPLVGSLQECLFGSSESKAWKCNCQWALRYQVHVKCRGVLATKGYVVGIEFVET